MSVPDGYKKIPIFGSIIAWMADNDMDYGWVAASMAMLLLIIGLAILGISGGQIISVLFFLAPIWLPIMLFFVFFHKYSDLLAKKYRQNAGRSTLRIKLPPEVMKTPEAMETVLNQVWNKQTQDNVMQTYIDGKQPQVMSLEIASIGGEVRFYINCARKKTRDAVEANLYAQYPGIEVVEEPVDYMAEIPLGDEENYNTFSLHVGKKEESPLMLKTYIDFGLDKVQKEEEKVDPLTPTLETLGTLRPFERVYVQYICIPHRKDEFLNGQLRSGSTWVKRGKEIVDEIMQRDPDTKGAISTEEDEYTGAARITPGERETIESIERNIEKYAYDVKVRIFYVTKPGHFNGDLINPMLRFMAQYDKIGGNGLGMTWRTDFNYMKLSDPTGSRLPGLRKQEHKELKLRKAFPKNQYGSYKTFSVEELATMFHLPGTVALTPTLDRISSTRGGAPANLPIGDQPNLPQ